MKWVRLRYRGVNQQLEYRTLPMPATGDKGHYGAVIPAEEISPTWDLMFFIEIMDGLGHGRIYPDLNRETPYIILKMPR